MKRVFYALRDQGLIEPVPDKKGKSFSWRKKVLDQSQEIKIADDLFEFADLKWASGFD